MNSSPNRTSVLELVLMSLLSFITCTGMVVKEIGNITISGTMIFHPHDNIFAMVAYGNRGSVYIFKE